jgi:hypothetical protein
MYERVSETLGAFHMKHQIFHPGETCWARIPTSTGDQWMQCDITGPRVRRPIRDLGGELIGYAIAYLVLMEEATMETPWPECDLRKKWQHSDWRALKCNWYGETKQIWQPPRAPVRRPTAWKQFK